MWRLHEGSMEHHAHTRTFTSIKSIKGYIHVHVIYIGGGGGGALYDHVGLT